MVNPYISTTLPPSGKRVGEGVINMVVRDWKQGRICYLNDLLFRIISCVKGILDCSLKTKSALKASINMITTLPNFGERGSVDFSPDGSGGRLSFVALPWIAFLKGKKPPRNSARPRIWQKRRRTRRMLWVKFILIRDKIICCRQTTKKSNYQAIL